MNVSVSQISTTLWICNDSILVLFPAIASQKTTNGISQISFNTEESTSPKKPTSLPEAAKQRELGGTLQNEPDTNSKKLMSSSKTKEFGGNDIFGTPRETVPRPLAVARTLDSKVSSVSVFSALKSVMTSYLSLLLTNM